MKIQVIVILLCFLTYPSCGDKDSMKVTLTGVLGKRLESKIELEQKGDTYVGHFINLETEEKIFVRGVNENGRLRLEEYNTPNRDKLTGIFEGAFDGVVFKGAWRDTKANKKVGFEYRLDSSSLKKQKKRKVKTSSPKAARKAINAAYLAWVNRMIDKGEFWSEEDWREYKQSWEGRNEYATNDYLDNCKDGLKREYNEIEYGDINQDGQIDAWVSTFPLYCMGGTALRFSSIRLFFLSTATGEYEIIKEQSIMSHRRRGNSVVSTVDEISDDGLVTYSGYNYAPDDAMCCPSIVEKHFYRFDGKRLVEVKK